MESLIDILNALGYPIEKGVYGHLYRTKTLFGLISGLKKMN
jgi:hypothetical protein